MTPKDFFAKYNGKPIDYDGYYGNQCVDLYRQYVKECLEYPQSSGVQGAANIWDNYLQDYFERVDNTPDGVPKLGDVIIWNKNAGGGFGHVGVFDSGNTDNFISFDQNWPVNSFCHFQSHNYINVLGWLRPKKFVEVEPQPAITDQTVIPQLGMEVQAIVSKIKDQEQTIYQQENVINDLQKRVKELEAIVTLPDASGQAENTVHRIHDILYGSGLWFIKYWDIKKLIPKT